MSAMQSPQAESLQAEVETAIVRELREAFQEMNSTHFKGALATPTLLLGDAEGFLGRWSASHRTIEISRKLVFEHPWGSVLEVLKHEMAHQYVHEVLGNRDETAHGPAFRRVCERLGIDASAMGLPTTEVQSKEEIRVLQRISRLLALAESPNLNEAQLAMNEAQRLMLKYNLDLRGVAQRYDFRHLGEPSMRLSEYEQVLASLLNRHFFVDTIWVYSYEPRLCKKGRVLEIVGTHANLEMAAYVYSFLRHTAARLWEEHKRIYRIRGDRDRRTFFAGVMAGFRDKLEQQKALNQCEGLVYLKDPDLNQYMRRRHPRIRTSSITGGARNTAHHLGRVAGSSIVLSRPVTQGSSGSGQRALPAKRG